MKHSVVSRVNLHKNEVSAASNAAGLLFQANPGNELEDAVRLLITRVDALEAQNAEFRQENDRLSHANDVLNERQTRQNGDHQCRQRKLEEGEAKFHHGFSALEIGH